MCRVGFVLLVALLLNGVDKPPTMKDLTFLTRDGCVNTPDMLNNVDDALSALKLPHDYQFIDIGKLPIRDVRTGYPAPTLIMRLTRHWPGRKSVAATLRAIPPTRRSQCRVVADRPHASH
jgi:hypothetical protein